MLIRRLPRHKHVKKDVIDLTESAAGGGVSDHGALTGLADDDHAQYHTDARGDGRYAPLAKGVTGGDSHDHVGGDGAQIDHAGLANKGTNTHAQIDTHVGSTSNPHTTTAAQVGLGNVTNDAQLKRGDGDINSLAQKPTPIAGDVLLLEDSAASFAKRKVTWNQLPAGGGGGLGYALSLRAASQSTTTDGQTLYWGGMLVAPSTTANRWRVYIPKAGIIKAAYIYSFAGTAGSGEAWMMNIRKNNATDTLIASVSLAAADRVWSNVALNIAVVAGDWIEIKEVCPTWATNPATVTRTGVIYIE